MMATCGFEWQLVALLHVIQAIKSFANFAAENIRSFKVPNRAL
jgi:hypothetical protein